MINLVIILLKITLPEVATTNKFFIFILMVRWKLLYVIFLRILHREYSYIVKTDQQMRILSIHMYFVIILALHVSVVRPPPSGGTRGHRHRFASNSRLMLHLGVYIVYS
jgi:hypothetical protein